MAASLPDADALARLRRHVVALYEGSEAHGTFDQAVADLPADLRGAQPDGQPHTVWRLVEHLRISQADIFGYATNPDHVSPPWPDEHWPKTAAPPDDAAWHASLASFRKTAEAFKKLLANPATDLLAPLPHDREKSILRQALLNADHTSYHLGQIVLLRRLMDAPADTV